MILLNLPAIHFVAPQERERQTKWIWCYVNKTEANLASTRVLAARCVRVIHAQCVLQFALLSRTLLRSSSNNEPSDPPYRMIFFFCSVYVCLDSIHIQWQNNNDLLRIWKSCNDKSHTMMQLVIYIMVRHNHTHECMMIARSRNMIVDR